MYPVSSDLHTDSTNTTPALSRADFPLSCGDCPDSSDGPCELCDSSSSKEGDDCRRTQWDQDSDSDDGAPFNAYEIDMMAIFRQHIAARDQRNDCHPETESPGYIAPTLSDVEDSAEFLDCCSDPDYESCMGEDEALIRCTLACYGCKTMSPASASLWCLQCLSLIHI